MPPSRAIFVALLILAFSETRAYSTLSHAHSFRVQAQQRAALLMTCVEIYSMPQCRHCVTAKAFLAARSVPYTEVDVTADPLNLGTMLIRTRGQHTVPQIFVDDNHIGGCSDMLEAADAGSLCLGGYISTTSPPPADHRTYYTGLSRLLAQRGELNNIAAMPAQPATAPVQLSSFDTSIC